jgi:hypothetical protein
LKPRFHNSSHSLLTHKKENAREEPSSSSSSSTPQSSYKKKTQGKMKMSTGLAGLLLLLGILVDAQAQSE